MGRPKCWLVSHRWTAKVNCCNRATVALSALLVFYPRVSADFTHYTRSVRHGRVDPDSRETTMQNTGSTLMRPSLFVAALAWFALILPLAQAQQFNVLYRFNGPDGSRPDAGVVMDSAGDLYGTAFVGGSGYGTAWLLKHHTGGYTLSVLHKFTGGADGANPLARIVFGPGGLLFGSASAGGSTNCTFEGLIGCGTIFTLQPPASFCRSITCPWTQNVIHSFTGGTDGWQPNDDLIFDASGNMYGIASDGGLFNSCNGLPGCGSHSNSQNPETVGTKPYSGISAKAAMAQFPSSLSTSTAQAIFTEKPIAAAPVMPAQCSNWFHRAAAGQRTSSITSRAAPTVRSPGPELWSIVPATCMRRLTSGGWTAAAQPSN